MTLRCAHFRDIFSFLLYLAKTSNYKALLTYIFDLYWSESWLRWLGAGLGSVQHPRTGLMGKSLTDQLVYLPGSESSLVSVGFLTAFVLMGELGWCFSSLLSWRKENVAGSLEE